MKLNQWNLDTADSADWIDDDYLSCLWGRASARTEAVDDMRSAKQTLQVEGMAGVSA